MSVDAGVATVKYVDQVGLLTGGVDKSYALGLAGALASQGLSVDFVGSDDLDCPQLHEIRGVNVLNLRGDQRADVPLMQKVVRILVYYARLMKYVATAKPRILHTLWNNKFELFDRTLLLLYYRLAGKRIVFTAHNINSDRRDLKDSWLNRWSLFIQYRVYDRIFVHTDRMKRDLVHTFGVESDKIVVIPFGINNTCPASGLASHEAKRLVGLRADARVVLFFGNIAPYKGLHYLIDAISILARTGRPVHLLIAGRVKPGHNDYWRIVEKSIRDRKLRNLIVQRIQYIPDEDVERYFMAADAVVIPYTDISQSGVPFLAYSFGLPVISTDVGSLRDDVIDGRTGFVCQPMDPVDLANTIEQYYASELYGDLEGRRAEIRAFANERYSWTKVAQIIKATYGDLLVGN